MSCKHNCLKPKKNTKKECPDHLKNWEEWIEKRRPLYEKFYRELGRKPGELAMNYGEDFIKIQEQRTLFEYAKIDTHFDKYRGNPEFWHFPNQLKVKQPDMLQYFAIKSNAQRNVIPKMEFIATPAFVLEKQKHLCPLLRSIFAKWSCSKYRKQQLEVLRKKIESMEPHIPNPSTLFVVGEKLLSTSSTPEQKKSVQNLESNTQTAEISFFEVHRIEKVSLSVNTRRKSSTSKISFVPHELKYFFCFSDLITPVEEKLELKNTGLSTLRVNFRKLQKYKMFKEYVQIICVEDSPFYFGMQEILIPPGETAEIPIWFLPKKHGIYLEKWAVDTSPKIPTFQLTIVFESLTEDEKMQRTIERIRNDLERAVKNTIVKECLTDLINNFKFEASTPKVCHITEEHLFESKNLEENFGVIKPMYVFEPNAVTHLRTIYSEIKPIDAPNFEHISVDDMKMFARRADVLNYIMKLVNLNEKTKKMRLNLEGRTQNVNGKIRTEGSSDNWKQTHTTSYYELLNNILGSIQYPQVILNHNREKYVMAFSVMRIYFIKMCSILEPNALEYEDDYNPTINLKLFIQNPPERLVRETLYDIWIPKIQSENFTSNCFPVSPKPKILVNIPKDDVKAVYNAYFTNRTSFPKDKTFSRDQEQQSKLSNVTSEGNEDNQDYSFFESSTTNVEDTSLNRNDDSTQTCNGHYDRYVSVYTILQNAVDALVDFLEAFREDYVSPEILQEVLQISQGERSKTKSLDLDALQFCNNEDPTVNDDYFQNLLQLLLINNRNVVRYIIEDRVPGEDALVDEGQTSCSSRSSNSVDNDFQTLTDN